MYFPLDYRNLCKMGYLHYVTLRLPPLPMAPEGASRRGAPPLWAGALLFLLPRGGDLQGEWLLNSLNFYRISVPPFFHMTRGGVLKKSPSKIVPGEMLGKGGFKITPDGNASQENPGGFNTKQLLGVFSRSKSAIYSALLKYGNANFSLDLFLRRRTSSRRIGPFGGDSGRSPRISKR
jgi:hypothetical protein